MKSAFSKLNKIGFLHIGVIQNQPSGVTRYGCLLAEEQKKLSKVEVREASVTLTSDKVQNIRKIKHAFNVLNDCDLIHLQFSPNLWKKLPIKSLILILFKQLQVPLILTLHDTSYLNYFTQFKYELFRRRNSNTSAVLTQLNEIIKQLILLFYLMQKSSKIIIHSSVEFEFLPLGFFWRNKINIIPHFAEDRKLAVSATYAKKILGLENCLVVTILGFIFNRKGYDLAIESASQFPEGTKLILAGGPAAGNEAYLHQLLAKVDKKGLKKNILVTGFLSDEEQDLYIAATDIALAPYRSMSASGSISTWIGAEKPLILASDLPEISNFNKKVPGVIQKFSPYTPDALAAKVGYLSTQLHEHSGTELVSRLKSSITIEQVARLYLTNYNKVAKNNILTHFEFLPIQNQSSHQTLRVSIVVPVRNNRKGIEKLLNSLESLDFPRQDFEIIIVDNGSEDETLNFLRSKKDIRLLFENHKISSYAARNVGIEASLGQILAFTDSDCEVDPQWLKRALLEMGPLGYDIVSGKIQRRLTGELSASNLIDDCLYLRNDLYYKQGVSATANTFIKKKCFESIGLFPDILKGGGDWVWTAHATRAGFKLGYFPEAVIYHQTHDFISLAKKFFRGGTCYKEVSFSIDPTGKYYKNGIRNLWRLKSLSFCKKKLAHTFSNTVSIYPLKSFVILNALQIIKLIGVVGGMLGLNKAKHFRSPDSHLKLALNIPMNSFNPYQYLFYEQLTKAQIELIRLPSQANIRDLLFKDISIFHIHWCAMKKRSFFFGWIDIGQFALILLICKWRGIQIWWTAHNLMPHDTKYPRLQLIKRLVVSHLSDLILVHSEGAKELLASSFHVSKEKMVLLHHGTYETYYLNSESPWRSKTILEIPSDKVVFLYFGQMRRYKNIDTLIRAFRQFDFPNALLLICGNCFDEAYIKEIMGLAEGDSRIVIRAEYIDVVGVSRYFNAADCVVLPYRDIFTSGCAMLAKTFKKFLIMKDCSFAREYFNEKNSMLIKEPDVDGIKKAFIDFILNRDSLDKIQDTDAYSWQNSVMKFLKEEKVLQVLSNLRLRQLKVKSFSSKLMSFFC